MTELLYLNDAYLKNFKAMVKEVNGRFIILDKTAFYPQGGGQPCDIGKITSQNNETYNVTFVKKIGNDISHEVDREGLRESEIIEGEIDWERRFRLMRSHTAAHILAAVIHKRTGAKITGNQLDVSKVRIDFNLENFDKESLSSYIDEANSIISQNLDVNVEELPRDEAFKIPDVVKLKDILPPAVDKIRIVSIPGIDRQACGGLHVSNTREIGKITLVKAENKGANNRRVYFILE
ncbi:alanyl-tRNA editing protein [Candidatus Woesearchaeota archaeon]|nr:MAG: alanyl-tRNA editing protein [Candidatus Woesearchaeota archaeon]